MFYEHRKDDLLISTDPAKLDLQMIHAFLKSSYWATGVQFEKVKKSVENSLCFGVYLKHKQVGFARVISDLSRIAYLADVFVLEPYRGQGLSKQLMNCIMQHPDLQNLNKWILVTHDAHGLYQKYGFLPLRKAEMYMEIVNRADL